jgi:hypothetical protein
MANKKISYTTRDFQSIRNELISFTKTYYPDVIDNFNDASVFSALLDLNAAVSDNLQFNIDRSIQETVLQYAQQRSSIYNIARTYGLKIPGQRPSVAVVKLSIVVPVLGDKEDLRYCGILRKGSQLNGAGQIFETLYDVDFASPIGGDGTSNRLKIPNFDSSGTLLNYTIIKLEPCINGSTRVFKKTITPNNVRPFYEVFLPEKNVLGVTSVLLKDGTSYANVPSVQEFLGNENRWYEVRALVEDRVFVEDPTKVSDQPGIKVGKYMTTNTKFITEYTPEGFMKLTFGGGTQSLDEQLREFARNGYKLDLYRYSNNFALGSTLKANSTLFIQYRVGGGLTSNVGVNVINQIGTVDFAVNGPLQTENVNVINSLSCTNEFAAIGGAPPPSIEEVRNYVTYNFAAQQRAVTINDYYSLINTMPSQFGAPAKVQITEENNKILIKLLNYDNTGKLSETLTNTLKSNVANYISNYRMINDYVVVTNGSVIDLAFEVSVVFDNSQNQGTLITNIVNIISTYLNPFSREMGQNIYLSEIKRLIQSENGVVTISELRVFGRVGGQYSSSETSQSYLDPETKEIKLIQDTIFATPTQIYQVRFPTKDITVRVLNFSNINIS